MTYELKGPGGVGIGYGSRTTTTPGLIGSGIPKKYYKGMQSTVDGAGGGSVDTWDRPLSTEPLGGIGTNVIFDLSTATSTSGTASLITDGSTGSIDPSTLNVAQIGPGGTFDQALASAIVPTGIETISFSARAVRVSDSERYSSAKILISDSPAGFTNFGSSSFGVRADGRWRTYTIPLHALASGSWPAGSNIGRVRLREGDGVGIDGRPVMGAGDRIQLGPIRINPRGRAIFIPRFDDGLDVLRTNKSAVVASTFSGQSGVVVPPGTYTQLEILQMFGFRASCYILTDFVGLPGFESWEGFKDLQSAGWSICVQAAANPIGNAGEGARLLGPVGYNLYPSPGDVTSVSNSVFTISAARPDSIATVGNALATGIQPFPVQVLGSVPAPLVTGGVYYALRRGPRQFSLHSVPVGHSPSDDNRGLIAITGTDVSGMTLRYAGSANDSSAIAADYARAQSALQAHGLTGFQHLALNQGGHDKYIEDATFTCGFKTVSSVARSVGFVTSVAGMVSVPPAVGVSLTAGGNGVSSSSSISIPCVIQTDGTPTAAQARAFVANVVRTGSVGTNYHHGGGANGYLVLMAMLDQAKVYSDAGMLDVMTIEQYYARLVGSKAPPSVT